MADGSSPYKLPNFQVSRQCTPMGSLAAIAPATCPCKQGLLCECTPAERTLRNYLHNAAHPALTDAQRYDCLNEIQAFSMSEAMRARKSDDYTLVITVLSSWGRVTLPGEGLFFI